ncbi:MAG TPA: hypothetical protein VFZ01_03080 [Geminicoccaceae bacterium]
MRSRTTKTFWRCFAAVPPEVQVQAARAYRLWRTNPAHPSLRLKKIGRGSIYSLRITRNHRALGSLEGDTMLWFWIGSHEDYERML